MIGTEMLKFQTEYVRDRIDAGVYICITDELLDFFNQRPASVSGSKSFRGSITMEKACKYLEEVNLTITVPIAVMGLLPP